MSGVLELLGMRQVMSIGITEFLEGRLRHDASRRVPSALLLQGLLQGSTRLGELALIAESQSLNRQRLALGGRRIAFLEDSVNVAQRLIRPILASTIFEKGHPNRQHFLRRVPLRQGGLIFLSFNLPGGQLAPV